MDKSAPGAAATGLSAAIARPTILPGTGVNQPHSIVEMGTAGAQPGPLSLWEQPWQEWVAQQSTAAGAAGVAVAGVSAPFLSYSTSAAFARSRGGPNSVERGSGVGCPG